MSSSVGTEMACAILFEQAAREFNDYESFRAHLRDRCDENMRHSLACIYNSPTRYMTVHVAGDHDFARPSAERIRIRNNPTMNECVESYG